MNQKHTLRESKIQLNILREKCNSLPNIWVEQKRSYNFCLPSPQSWYKSLYPVYTVLL